MRNATITLTIGTQKGLFMLRAGHEREHWEIDGPYVAGYAVAHAWLDAHDPDVGYAAANHPVWGAHIYRSADSGRSWQPLRNTPCHAPGVHAQPIGTLWFLTLGHPAQGRPLYAGIDPPGLFVSHDRGGHWEAVSGLNRHPTRPQWEPARGGFAVHSIYPDPSDAQRLYAAVSAGGAFRTDDGGSSFTPINRGVRAENLPNANPVVGHNIHRLLVHPARPSRLYRQCYNGVYRSDDRGETWVEITHGLPSDFGYAIVSHPRDPDTVFVVPEESQQMRAVVAGRLRVYRSRDGGASWSALSAGLPQRHAYVSVLREAMAMDSCDPPGVYFGTSGGHLFASRDAGEYWELIAGFLPRILSVQAVSLD
ncbi:MAG: WD40/YVTN/BNR-like repeat-containing protein [Gammaproteobacteria bacterium]